MRRLSTHTTDTQQVIATVVVLTFSWDMYCDKPLRVFLTVYILRVFLSAPLSVYLHLAPRRRRQQQQEQQEQQDNNRHHSHQNSNPGSDSIVDAEAGTSYMLTDRRQNPTNSLPPNSEHDTSLSSWIDRAKSALDMFALLWFIIGNYMLFTSTTCSETAVPLYYLSFVIIIYGYVVLSVPILLCTAVIFCLPCVLVGMRILHVEDAEDMGGASKDEIARIPVYRFKSHSNIPATTEDMEMHELPQKPQQQEQVVREQTHSFWSQLQTRFGLSNESDDQRHIEHEPELDTIEIPNEQDRVCAICLSTYDDGDILCKLWCNHHFHKTCVHEWLVLNSRCPMCKRDSRGKQYPAMDC